jgi:hypothetical protein
MRSADPNHPLVIERVAVARRRCFVFDCLAFVVIYSEAGVPL